MIKTLPLYLSIPHAGLSVPEEVQDICLLTAEQIKKDGDEGASEIYSIQDHVLDFVTTDIARAFVDVNRAETEIRDDGVVKTQTIWGEPIYSQQLDSDLVDTLIEKYHRTYHREIHRTSDDDILLFVDCHTMADIGPPIARDCGGKRPMVCLGDCGGTSLPAGWIEMLEKSFLESFGNCVTVNQPFSGGYITQTHKESAPWLQLEVSRTNELSDGEKRDRVLHALRLFCDNV